MKRTSPLSTNPVFALSLIACTLVSTGPAFAVGVRIPEQDAHAAARGNAFAATADNPSAVYYNPAGITQLDGQNVSLGAYGIVMRSEFENASTSAETKATFQAVPELFYTWKSSKYPVAAGLGVYLPYGLGMEWPKSAPFTALSQRGQIEYVSVNPVIAWEPIKTVSVAIGPTLNRAQADLQTVPASSGSNFRFRGSDFDAGFNAGILWHPLEQHSFGVNYRSMTEMNFKGHADTAVPAIGFFRSDDASAEFRFPRHLVLGYSFRPTTNWNFEVNADWTDWNNLNTVTLVRPGQPDLPMNFNWQSSWMYQFGATRYLPNDWSVSAGYIFSENSVPDDAFNPGVPDSDRHIFCLGLGKKYQKFSWDAAYQFAWGPTRTLNNAPTAWNARANGRYEFFSHALTFNVGYRF